MVDLQPIEKMVPPPRLERGTPRSTKWCLSNDFNSYLLNPTMKRAIQTVSGRACNTAPIPNRNRSDEDRVMAFRALPSIEMLRQLLQFDPEAGTLLWLPRTRAAFPRMNALAHWNEKFANKPAFTAKDSDGYHVGWCMGQMLKAHRVIWALHYGEWPAAELDHINRNRADNRIANLRLSNRVANLQNTGLRTTNKSGYPGVHWHQAKGRWRAAIRSGGRKIHLGYFDDAASASRAYERARAALHTGSMSA